MKRAISIIRVLASLGTVLMISLPIFSQTSSVTGTSSAQPSTQQFLALDDLIKEAVERNPELRAAMRDVDAKRARVPQEGSLPDPMLMFGQNNEENIIPFTTLGKNGFSEVYIGFTQDFPFFGKRGLKKRVASSEADAAWWEFQFARRQVIANVKEAYYDLFYLHQALEIVQKNVDLMERFAKIAEALYKVGKGAQADVLRANTEISRLEERLETFRQQKGIGDAQINALLNRPPDTPVDRPAPVAKAPLRYSLEQLKEIASENFPMLKRERRMIDSRSFALKLAEKEKYPDFGFTFTYHNRGGLADYWTIGGTAKIPLYFSSKQRYGIDQAAAELAASRERYSNTLALLFFRLKDQYLRATTSDRLVRLYGEAITPQETLTLDATIASYETGKVDFLSVIDSAIKLLNDELTYYEHLTNYQKALARLEPFVGVELTR